MVLVRLVISLILLFLIGCSKPYNLTGCETYCKEKSGVLFYSHYNSINDSCMCKNGVQIDLP